MTLGHYLTFYQNTFAEKLGDLGFDTFRMLVVDFMHECELGTWKALFTHLIRLLYAFPGGERLVANLDNRFIPLAYSPYSFDKCRLIKQVSPCSVIWQWSHTEFCK